MCRLKNVNCAILRNAIRLSRHYFDYVATLVLFVMTNNGLVFLKSQESMLRNISLCRDTI